MIDVSRDPRWGRVVEGFGEDVHLNAVMGAAMVRGYQGPDLAGHGTIAATAKHYVGYGQPEGGRDYNAVDVSAHRLRNVYLEPFRAAVQAGVASIMASFNTVAGVPMHVNRALLTDVLKSEWGFGGAVVGDAEGVANLLPHRVAETLEDAVRAAYDAGLDIEMGGTPATIGLDAASLDPVRLDDAVARVLGMKEALGLFDRPYVDEAEERRRADRGVPCAGQARRRPLGRAAAQRRHTAALYAGARAADRPLRDLDRSPGRLDPGVLRPRDEHRRRAARAARCRGRRLGGRVVLRRTLRRHRCRRDRGAGERRGRRVRRRAIVPVRRGRVAQRPAPARAAGRPDPRHRGHRHPVRRRSGQRPPARRRRLDRPRARGAGGLAWRHRGSGGDRGPALRRSGAGGAPADVFPPQRRTGARSTTRTRTPDGRRRCAER